MKLFILLFFLTGCNPVIKEAVKSDPIPSLDAPPAWENLKRYEAEETKKRLYAEDFIMNCTADLVPDPHGVAIYRCENQEVICYSEHRGGMTCKFK